MKGNITTPNLAILIRPRNFSYNNQTCETNHFQNKNKLDVKLISRDARNEFNILAKNLIDFNINSIILSEQKTNIKKPDAIFSNNWIVYMPNKQTYTMPMLNKNRKLEIDNNLIYKSAYRCFESSEESLEGTGSMVFDHMNKKIYSAISERTSTDTLIKFAKHVKYELIYFNTEDSNNNKIYHTNVMMSVGEKWAVLCKDVVTDSSELIKSLSNDNKEIIYITEDEMKDFCANIFELRDNDDNLTIYMSDSARNTFKEDSLDILKKYADIISINIPTIESIGGGSIRCIITGAFI